MKDRYWPGCSLRLSRLRWVAYAACLMDATPLLTKIIAKSSDPSLFVDAVNNSAPFVTAPIGRALVRRFQIDGFQGSVTYVRDKTSAQVGSDGNFLYLASNPLIAELLAIACAPPVTKGKEMLYLVARCEIERREMKTPVHSKTFPENLRLAARLGRTSPQVNFADCLRSPRPNGGA